LGSTGSKAARRTMMKLTPGVNFTNIIHEVFTQADPKNTKNTVKFFALLGSVHVKAAPKILVKLIPRANPIYNSNQ